MRSRGQKQQAVFSLRASRSGAPYLGVRPCFQASVTNLMRSALTTLPSLLSLPLTGCIAWLRTALISACSLAKQPCHGSTPAIRPSAACSPLVRAGLRAATSGANWHHFNPIQGVQFWQICSVLFKHAGVPNWAVKGTKTASCFFPPRFALRCPLPGC